MLKIILKVKNGYYTGVWKEIWSAPLVVNTCQFFIVYTWNCTDTYVFWFLQQAQDGENQEWRSPRAYGPTVEDAARVAA